VNDQPLVSICLPAYNASAFLSDTVRGVCEQTSSDWELVIVDNASTDDTKELLERLLKSAADPRIRVFRNPSTVPAPENWNIAVSHSRGRYIKLLCADDIPARDCLERQALALEDNPSAVLAAGSRTIINSCGRNLFVRNGVGQSGLYDGRAMIRRCIMSGTNIIGDPVNVTWRRSAMEQVGLFDPEIVYCTDVEYWLRLLSVGDMYFDAEPVGFYRIHSQAAATGLAAVTVDDFERTARKQAHRGTVALSRMDIRILRAKSWLQSKIRQLIYRLLG
jgi:glycosyltransferase involved in cell wall biosynthesis